MKACRHLALFALLVLVTGLGVTASQADISLAQTAPRPNILFIMGDDLRASDLDYMPNTQDLLTSQGVKFTKAWTTRSLCCPSRATTLRGQYAHNHKVWVNVEPSGGFWSFLDQGHESSTVATWLNSAGYDTVLIGKYLNRYGLDRDGNYNPTPHVPPGWNEWYAWEGMYTGTDTSYKLNENGRIVTYQRSQFHDTDLHADQAVRFLTEHANDPLRENTPFFMYLAPNAPHNPAFFAPRHANMFLSTPLPRPSSFNEADVSDKPQWVRNKSLLSSTEISNLTNFYRKRLRALQSLDEMVERLVRTLEKQGQLSNTYIVFTSDNGIYLGEHRLTEKAAAYNAAPRIPLLIRGPGVPRGVTRSQMALNNDLAPTFASWAGISPPSFVDGRSLAPLLSASPPASWRTAFLVEHRQTREEFGYVRAIPNYDAIRTAQYNYVEYETGERELYDLNADPTELTSLHTSAAHSAVISNLKARLDALKSCTGQTCRTAEGG